MAVTAKILRYIIDAGGSNAEFIHVAEAMERGDDAWRMFKLVAEMEDAGCWSSSEIGSAVVGCADDIKEEWKNQQNYRCSGTDPYRERRGLSGSVWKRLRQTILERDGHKCNYCGATDDLAVDHIIPLSRGGTNDPENLTPACKPCNSSKGDRLIEEWMGSD